MPVYLNYFGARRTGRWSGGDSANWQNFPRTGELGECISAPKGEPLIIADAAQIECRILNYVASQDDVIEAFREGRDIYCEIASAIYGCTITSNDKSERYFGENS
jgi:DNA polymerase bacteriophage-type